MPDQPTGPSDLTPAFLLGACLVVAAAAVALTYGTGLRWIGHAVTGLAGLLLLAMVILTGAFQKGRISHPRFRHAYRFHRSASIAFSLFVIATFVLGLLTTMGMGEEVMESPHGLAGLVLVLLAGIQLVPSLVVVNRDRIRSVHRIVGYVIVPVFLLQTLLGILAATSVPG